MRRTRAEVARTERHARCRACAVRPNAPTATALIPARRLAGRCRFPSASGCRQPARRPSCVGCPTTLADRLVGLVTGAGRPGLPTAAMLVARLCGLLDPVTRPACRLGRRCRSPGLANCGNACRQPVRVARPSYRPAYRLARRGRSPRFTGCAPPRLCRLRDHVADRLIGLFNEAGCPVRRMSASFGLCRSPDHIADRLAGVVSRRWSPRFVGCPPYLSPRFGRMSDTVRHPGLAGCPTTSVAQTQPAPGYVADRLADRFLGAGFTSPTTPVVQAVRVAQRVVRVRPVARPR